MLLHLLYTLTISKDFNSLFIFIIFTSYTGEWVHRVLHTVILGEKNESYEIFKKEIISLVDSFMRATLYWQKKTKILQEKKIYSDISHERIWKKSFSKY